MVTKKAISKSKSTAKRKSTVKAARVSVKVPAFLGTIVKKAPFIGALIAEFFGTFLFASAVITGQGQPIIVMFAIAGIVLLVGAMSGAHLNPAITIAAWITRKITWMRALGYIVFQSLGALAALGLLTAFVSGAPVAESSLYGQTPELFKASALPVDKEWYVFFAEVVGALILGYVVAGAINAFRKGKDVVVQALTYGFGAFVALLIAVSAASYVAGSAIINPSIALSLEALKWEMWPLAVYVLAPIIGATAGFFLYDFLSTKSDGGKD